MVCTACGATVDASEWSEAHHFGVQLPNPYHMRWVHFGGMPGYIGGGSTMEHLCGPLREMNDEDRAEADLLEWLAANEARGRGGA